MLFSQDLKPVFSNGLPYASNEGNASPPSRLATGSYVTSKTGISIIHIYRHANTSGHKQVKMSGTLQFLSCSMTRSNRIHSEDKMKFSRKPITSDREIFEQRFVPGDLELETIRHTIFKIRRASRFAASINTGESRPHSLFNTNALLTEHRDKVDEIHSRSTTEIPASLCHYYEFHWAGLSVTSIDILVIVIR